MSARVVVVTGASRGIGLACADWFAERGDAVAALSASGTEVDGAALSLRCDVADPSAVGEAFTEVEAALGECAVLVANAGITDDQLTLRMGDEAWRRVLDVNLSGAFHTPLMAPAAAALAPALQQAAFEKGTMGVLANVDGAVHEDPAEWPALLLRQLTTTVDFHACVLGLPTGAAVVECGPGGVLKGLIARIRDDLDVVSVGTPGDLGAVAGVR